MVDAEIARTIDAEAQGLVDAFDNQGIRRLKSVIEARKNEPGASLYLLTNPIGEPLAGNVEQIPAEVLLHRGFRPSPIAAEEAAIAATERWWGFTFYPGGFRLLIGHDLGDRAESAR